MARKKAVYRPRNWSEYNKSLVGRGSLTLWISEFEECLSQVDGPIDRVGADGAYDAKKRFLVIWALEILMLKPKKSL